MLLRRSQHAPRQVGIQLGIFVAFIIQACEDYANRRRKRTWKYHTVKQIIFVLTHVYTLQTDTLHTSSPRAALRTPL